MNIKELREVKLEHGGLVVRAIGPCDAPPDTVQLEYASGGGGSIGVHRENIPQLIAVLETMHRKLKRWAVNGVESA